MYRIMLVRSKRDNFASLYQWLTATDEETGEVSHVEFDTEEALDEIVSIKPTMLAMLPSVVNVIIV